MQTRRHNRTQRKLANRKERIQLNQRILATNNDIGILDELKKQLESQYNTETNSEQTKKLITVIKEHHETINQLYTQLKNDKKRLEELNPTVLQEQHLAAVKAEQRRKHLAKHPPHGPGKKK